MSDEDFAKQYQEKSFSRTHKHNDHDDDLDDLESKLIKKLAQTAETIYDPMKLTAIASKVNAMKRRGTTIQSDPNESAKIVTLVLPTILQTRFTMNSRNQVIEAGNQTLVTLQSGQLDRLVQTLPAKTNNVPVELLSENSENSHAHNSLNRSGQNSPRDSSQTSQIGGLQFELEDEFGFRHENQTL